MWLTTLAAAHGEQRRRPHFNASTQQRREQCVFHAVSKIDVISFSHERIRPFFSEVAHIHELGRDGDGIAPGHIRCEQGSFPREGGVPVTR